MTKNPIRGDEIPPDFIAQAEVDAIVRRMTENLEARVKARTEDLRAANERLTCEIDERKAAEERLRESEELYRLTVELSRQLVWTASPDGTILSVGRRMIDVTGLPEGTAPNEGWLEVVHPDDREQLFDAWKAGLEAGIGGVAEFRMRVADDSYRTFRSRVEPRFDADGNVVRWYGLTEDVHDQKLAEAAQLEAEELYRLAARATNDALWDHDLADDAVRWSDTASETLGYPGRTLGTTTSEWWKERVHPDDRNRIVESLAGAIDRGETRWSATYRFRKGNGDYGTFFDRGFMVCDAAGKAVRVVGAMADITDRHRAEQEVLRMQAELVHVSRLSAMGTMASTLAHELNQPLTAVTNYVRGARRLMEEGMDEPRLEQAREALEAAENGALRAGRVVRRLRELVARGSSALRPEELPKLIEDAGVLAFLDAHLQGVTHRVELDPDADWVEVDRIQIQQVLINLIRNAVQAMQGMERREIVVRTHKMSPQLVEVSVADSGTGISPEVREALFSPFQGTKADGLGIGLSISRTIIESHGGKIWVEDAKEGGAIFRFTLPAYDGPSAPDLKVEAESARLQ
jgi:two-component system sensor kinase FixL